MYTLMTASSPKCFEIPMSSVKIWCSDYSHCLDDNIWRTYARVGQAIYFSNKLLYHFIPFHWWLRTWRIYKFKFVYILTTVCIPAYLRLSSAIFHTLFLITLFLSLFLAPSSSKNRIQSLSIFKSYLKLNRSIPKLYRERKFHS